MNDRDVDFVLRRYTERLEALGPVPEALGWTKGRHRLRYHVLLAPWEVVERRAKDVLSRGRTAEGHIFNLGHGVLPETDPGVLARLADLVHELSAS